MSRAGAVRRFGSVAAVGMLGLLGGCYLPGGGGGGPAAPHLTVSVPTPTVTCLRELGADTTFCHGSGTVTVTNDGGQATSVAPVLSVDTADATVDQGTCSTGPLAAGGSCTATLTFDYSYTDPAPARDGSGTVTATAGSVSGSFAYTTSQTP